MRQDIVISVQNLSKSYKLYNSKRGRLKEALNIRGKKYHREHKALDNISFEMKRGDCLAIIGKNGSGKSTLLQIIADLLKPSSGYVDVRGKILALVQLGATFNPEFTGLDNVFLYASVLGYSSKDIKLKLPEILRFADIGDFIDQKVKTYSSGMRSRLAFSVVISLDPEILIVDEVLSVGDMFFKQKCINKLKVMLEKGLTLFFVSHSLHDVKALCDKALYLEQGKMLAYGNVDEVTNLYQNSVAGPTKKTDKQGDTSENVEEENVKGQILPAADFDRHYSCSNLSCSTERSGDGALTYFKLSLFNENIEECNKVCIFESIQIAAYFHVSAEIAQSFDLGLVCRDARGYDVFVINSTDHQLDVMPFKSGQNYLWKVEIPQLLLSPGVYSLNIGAKPQKSGDNYYDRIFNACVFEVTRTQKMLANNETVHGCFFCEAKLSITP